MTVRPRRHLGRTPAVSAVLLIAGLAAGLLHADPAAATTPPAVNISPSPAGGSYANGQLVTVSISPNSLFDPNSRVAILECSDPGGSKANLPISLDNCDENTIQGGSILVNANGSLSEHRYPLYALPSATLGEKPGWLPACAANHACVLFVGEDQNDFTKPKVFSAPFTVVGGTSAPSTVPTAAGSTSPVTTAPSAAVTLSPATLAYTGPSRLLAGLAMIGSCAVGIGLWCRRAVRRWQR